MSFISDFVSAYVTKLKVLPIITDPNNVIVGETLDLQSKEDSFFPRIEVMVHKFPVTQYVDQSNMEVDLIISVAGFLRRTTGLEFTDQDTFDLADFACNVQTALYDFNTKDKIAGIVPHPYFIEIEANAQMQMANELIPYMGFFEIVPSILFHVPYAEFSA